MSQEDRLARAYALQEKGEYAHARAEFEALRAQGVKGVALHLGWLCDQGLGGPKDFARAETLYREAGTEDRCVAMYYLGALLMRSGRPLDAKNAFEEAAALGHPSATYWAYQMNLESAGEADKSKAREFLEKAAEQGHWYAKRDLARARMREASSTPLKIALWFKYAWSKIAGAMLILRNSEDIRVR